MTAKPMKTLELHYPMIQFLIKADKPHEPQASGLRIIRVFYQHPKWFISLKPIETCGLLLLYNNSETRDFSMDLPAQPIADWPIRARALIWLYKN